jgi:hypothetical protein
MTGFRYGLPPFGLSMLRAIFCGRLFADLTDSSIILANGAVNLTRARSCGSRRSSLGRLLGAWASRFYLPSPSFPGQVAQLVEQRTENPRVAGSIPALATCCHSTYRVGFGLGGDRFSRSYAVRADRETARARSASSMILQPSNMLRVSQPASFIISPSEMPDFPFRDARTSPVACKCSSQVMVGNRSRLASGRI